MKKIKRINILIIIIVILLTGCKSTSSIDKENLKKNTNLNWMIGAIAPLSGDNAEIGNSIKNGCQLAIEDLNSDGGINGYDVSFLCLDDEDDELKVSNDFNTLKDWGMNILIGGITEETYNKVNEEATNNGILMISPTSENSDILENDSLKFSLTDGNKGIEVADLVYKKNLGQSYEIVYDNKESSSFVISSFFNKEMKAKGLELKDRRSIDYGSEEEINEIVSIVKEKNPEIIFLPVEEEKAYRLICRFDEENIESKIVCLNDGTNYLIENENKYVEVYQFVEFSTYNKTFSTQSFIEKYQEKYGCLPDINAAKAYDSVRILKKLLEEKDIKPSDDYETIKTAVEEQKSNINYDGITGKNINWDQNGKLEKECKLLKIQNMKYKQIY